MVTKGSSAPEPPRLMSIEDAAHLLAVSERHLRTLSRRGHLRLVALGRRRLVERSEVDRIIAEGTP